MKGKKLILWLLLCFPSAAAADGSAQERPAGKVGKVTFRGNASAGAKELYDVISVPPGSRADAESLEFSRKGIIGHYRNSGYWEADVATASLPMASGRSEIIFSIREGPRYSLRAVRIRGSRLISDAIVLRELDLNPGAPFSPVDVYKGNRRLYQTGYFERIDVQYSTAPGHAMDVTFNLKERPTRFAKGSLGYGAESKERASLGVEDLNFLGNARRFNVKATHSGFLTNPQKYRTTFLQAELVQPYFFATRLEGTTSVSREYRERESYDSITTAWQSALARRFATYFAGRMQVRYNGTRVDNVTAQARAETADFYTVIGAGPILTFDDTDNLLLPRMGTRSQVQYEQGLDLEIGDVRFYKGTLNLGRYQSWRTLTFYAGFQAGVILPDSAVRSIPIPERFTLGGADSVRGYSERSLGPLGASGEPLGGEGYGATNLELRHPLYKKLYGMVFVDSGQVWRKPGGTIWPHVALESLDALRHGTGLGLRYLSPVGPIRLEFGYQLNPPVPTQAFLDRVEIHFALGESF